MIYDLKYNYSILEKIKSKLCRKGSNTPTPAESQHVKTSSEEDEISFSRTSSGIGTLSTKSKLFQEDDSQSIRDDSIVSINSQGNDFTKDSVIPVIQRHNFGVFSSKQANTSSSSGNDIHRRNTYDKYANFDKISIAENDDKDFEYFATKDDTDHENELKVQDWHVMLENTEQHHEHQVDFDDDGAKQRKNGKKKRLVLTILVNVMHKLFLQAPTRLSSSGANSHERGSKGEEAEKQNNTRSRRMCSIRA